MLEKEGKEYIPVYLRDKAEVVSFREEEDGAYALKVQIKDQGVSDFVVFIDKPQPTEIEKEQKKQLKQLKVQYADKLANGYLFASRIRDNLEILGLTKGWNDFQPIAEFAITWNHLSRVIKVLNPITGVETEIFNSDIHGYDGVTSGGDFDKPIFKKKGKCRKCGSETYKVFVAIHNTGKADLLSDETCGITEENWTNAFDWITIELVCSGCGQRRKRWVEEETM